MTRSLALKRKIGRALHVTAAARAPSRRIVLLYHAIGTSPWALPLETLESQIRYLARTTDVGTVDDLLAVTSAQRVRCAITFDDGYASLHDVAREPFRRAGIRPTVFLTSGWISTQERRTSNAAAGHYPGEAFMTWADVERLAVDGWQFGAHGHDHVDLTELTEARLVEEIEQSKRTIERRLGRSCGSYAYPWGRHTARVRTAVRGAGFDRAFSTRHGALSEACDPFQLPRIDVNSTYTLDDFAAIVRGDWDFLGHIQAIRAAGRRVSMASIRR